MPYSVNAPLPAGIRAPMIAWAAVKRSYVKDGDRWIERRQAFA